MNALVNNHRRSFIILLFIFWHAIAVGQLTANFTATPIAGCSPLLVNFTDISSGNPTQWKWDLGNGVISFLKNPSATYFNAGTYNVKLVVRNAAGVDSIIKNQYITVNANPDVDFKANKLSGCYPLKVDFTDSTQAGTGTITGWLWDFGDGNTSTLQHPTHTYLVAGSYTVTLNVTNSAGCIKTFSRPQYINVADGVKADFTNTAAGICPAPGTINFTNTSTGPGTITYTWLFGDGNTGNTTNPSHIYNANGTYSVSLIAVSSFGCSDSITKSNLITFSPVNANFTAPSATCINQQVSITQTSSPAPANVLWSFGDGTFSTVTNPVKTYTNTGTYTIKLVADFGGCVDSISKQIIVEPKPVAAFTASDSVFCKLPAAVLFTNQSAGNNTVVWNFGDGNTSTQNNPTHNYSSEGIYTVSLIITNSAGCSDTLIKQDYIQVQRPVISIAGFPQTGCMPITVNPVATITANKPVTGYLWNFGDGNTSTLATPTHTYTATGNYNVTLTITTQGGCTETVTIVNAVRGGTKPKAGFTFTPIDACAYQQVFFTDTSKGNVDQWYWSFGDGSFSTEQNPIHQYGDTGIFTIQLVVFNNTCSDTIRLIDAIHIKPPIAIFTVQNDCDNKFTKSFLDQSIGADSWFWEFGDGNTSTQKNPVHIYAATGSYNVKLTVSNDTCSHWVTGIVRVIDENAVFNTTDTVLCRNSPAMFVSSGIDRSNISAWSWNFGDGTSSNADSAVTHVYTTSGNYKVTLVITDLLGCQDSMSLWIKVHGPEANFAPPGAIACLYNNNITFTDLSTTDGIHPIVKWTWDYGDGTIDSAGIPPYSHSYATAGIYSVSLLVKDNFGCIDINQKPASVIISQPKADFHTPDTLTCVGKEIVFTNLSSATNPTYNWNLGDGNTSTNTSPAHQYGQTGVYTIKLLVTDQYGCKDSLTKPAYVTITYPKAKFTVSDSISTCPPLFVKFAHQASNYTSINWNFGDGNTATLDSPSHFYTLPGVYFATLTATSAGGCTDVATQKIEIKGPSGSFTYAPLTGCKPLQVNFNAITKNAATFTWDFADGNIDVTTDSFTTHTYIVAGEFSPKLILTDTGGCSVPITGVENIKVTGANASFTMSPSAFCGSGSVQFTNTTVSNDLITGYEWNFGDGNTSTSKDPSHNYATPGQYIVTLIVTTQSGCKDTVVLLDTVKIFPVPAFYISGDSSGCSAGILDFKGNIISGDSASLKWLWNFGNGNTDTVQNPATQHYATGNTYTITANAIDKNGCVASDTKTITVAIAPTVDIVGDTAVCGPALMFFTGALTGNNTGVVSWKWDMGNGQVYTTQNPPGENYPVGVYNITATIATPDGCTDTATRVVKVFETPQPQIVGDSSGCSPVTVNFKGTVSGNANNLSWAWDLGNGQTSGLQNPPVQVYAAGNYNISAVVTSSDGCTTVTSKQLNIYPKPATVASADAVICRGSFQQLSASGAASYIWNAAPGLSCTNCPNPLAAPTDSTAYVVTGFNGFGCSSKDTVIIKVQQPITLKVGNGADICVGKTVQLTANGADLYTWSPATNVTDPNAGVTTASPTTSTRYTVTARDANNCFTDTASVFITVWPFPTVEIGADQTVTAGTPVTLQPAYSYDVLKYQWTSPVTLSCATCPRPVANPRQYKTTYTVDVQNKGGCTATDQVTLYVLCGNGNLFIPNTFSPNSDGVNDRFYPRGSGLSTVKSMKIFNRWGELVFSKENFQANDAGAGWDGLYKGQPLTPDVYVYMCDVVCTNNEVLSYKGDVSLLR